MSTEEIKEAVSVAIREALQEMNLQRTTCQVCMFEPNQHRAEHEALRRVIAFFDRMEDVRWGMLRRVIMYIIVGVLALLAFGFKESIVHTFLGGP